MSFTVGVAVASESVWQSRAVLFAVGVSIGQRRLGRCLEQLETRLSRAWSKCAVEGFETLELERYAPRVFA